MKIGKIAKYSLALVAGYLVCTGVKGCQEAKQPYQIRNEKGVYYFVDKEKDLKIKAEKIAPMYTTVKSLADLIQNVESEKQSLRELLK